MEPGCGLEVKVVRGRRYLYLWCYGRRNGRSRKVETYLGPVRAPKTRERALRALLEHEGRLYSEVGRRIEKYRGALARMAAG